MKKEKKKLKLAIKQLINATWILRYEMPDDDINKTRKMLGETPEIIIYEHIRDDKYYNKTNILYNMEEDEGRVVKAVNFQVTSNGRIIRNARCPVRNQKHIFDYSYKGPIDKILDENEKYLEGRP